MESRVNIYDIYLHVKKIKLKSPDVFLTLVLKEFEITNLRRLFMTLFYITCFLWHYPCNSVSILRAIFHVIAFKIRNLYNRWKDKVKVKVGVLRPVQQPGSYWDRSSELPLVGLEPTEVTAYD